MQDLNLLELRAESTGVREREKFERDLVARRAASKAKTLFERLDVHWICTTPDIEAAYKKLKEEWSPAVLARQGEQYRAAFDEINAALDHAYATLSSDLKRREYRISVIERTKIEQSAEMLSKQGEMAIMKASVREATSCFSKALELVPNSAEYRDGLTRARNIPRA
jgi:DnaJ-class molecular chaperone